MLQREIDPAQLADIEKFEAQLARYLAGELEEDVFRVFRLNNGIYGQRQGGHNQMVRVKVPYGVARRPTSSTQHRPTSPTRTAGAGATSPPARTSSSTSCSSSRSPTSCATSPSSGSPRREACGDTVRNVQGCHLAGACPYEALDISPWAEAAFQHFLRHPLAQRLPRKFKINFSGCATDCGQAMFNDVGVIAVRRTNDDGTSRARLPGVRRRRPRRQPAPGPRPRGVHAPRGAHGHARGRSSGCSPTTATATTSCGPA